MAVAVEKKAALQQLGMTVKLATQGGPSKVGEQAGGSHNLEKTD